MSLENGHVIGRSASKAEKPRRQEMTGRGGRGAGAGGESGATQMVQSPMYAWLRSWLSRTRSAKVVLSTTSEMAWRTRAQNE